MTSMIQQEVKGGEGLNNMVGMRIRNDIDWGQVQTMIRQRMSITEC